MNGTISKPELVGSDGKACPYCSRAMSIYIMKVSPTKDHIKARSKTRGKKGRTIVVCSQCNFEKSTMSLEEFVTYLKAKNSSFLETITLNEQRIDNITYLIKSGLA